MGADTTLLSREDAKPADVHAALTQLLDDLPGRATPTLRRYATAFIDALLATGAARSAHKTAARAVAASRDRTTPPSRGLDHLEGAMKLESGGGYRPLIDPVVRLLARLAVADRGVVVWLFEAAKQRSSDEQASVYQHLRALGPTPAELDAGVAELVRFAGVLADAERGGEILRALALACRDDAAWMLALLTALASHPRAGERVLVGLHGREYGDPLAGRTPGWLLTLSDRSREDLERHAVCADVAVRTLAVFLLGQVPGVDVRPAALALLAGGGWPARLIVRLVIARAYTGGDVLAAIKQARVSRLTRAASSEELRDALDALAEAQDGYRPAAVHVDGAWAVILLPAMLCNPPVLRGDHVYLVVHRIRRRAPLAAVMTGEDEVGIIKLSPGTDARVLEIPLAVDLPMTRTRAAAAIRGFSLETQLGERLICSLHCPYADDQGTGARNYLFAFTPEDCRWEVLTPAPAPLPTHAGEAALPSLGDGRLIVWAEDGALRIAVNKARHDQDEWRHDEATLQALTACNAAAELLPWLGESLLPEEPAGDRWWLTGGGVLDGVQRRIVAACPAVADDVLRILDCVRLPDGRALVTLRRGHAGPLTDHDLVRTPYGQDIVVVAPVS